MTLHAKTVTVTGQFTEQDWQDVVEAIRKIERRHPDVEYVVLVADANLNTDQALAMMKRTFPRLPGDEPLFGVIKDDAMPGMRPDADNNPPANP